MLGSPKYGTKNCVTYNQMTVSMAMDLVGDVYLTASVLCDGRLAFLLRLEVPDEVVIFRVFDKFLWGHRPLFGHGEQRTVTGRVMLAGVLQVLPLMRRGAGCW